MHQSLKTITCSGRFASAMTQAGALAMYGICCNCSVSDFHSEMKAKKELKFVHVTRPRTVILVS